MGPEVNPRSTGWETLLRYTNACSIDDAILFAFKGGDRLLEIDDKNATNSDDASNFSFTFDAHCILHKLFIKQVGTVIVTIRE